MTCIEHDWKHSMEAARNRFTILVQMENFKAMRLRYHVSERLQSGEPYFGKKARMCTQTLER